MGMVGKLVKITGFVLFVTLIVMRSDVANYVAKSRAYVNDFTSSLFEDERSPTDIISLTAKMNQELTPTNNGISNGFSKNKDLFLNEIVPRLRKAEADKKELQHNNTPAITVAKADQEQFFAPNVKESDTDDTIDFELDIIPLSEEMLFVKSIAAKKFAKLKAELDLLEEQEALDTIQDEFDDNTLDATAVSYNANQQNDNVISSSSTAASKNTPDISDLPLTNLQQTSILDSEAAYVAATIAAANSAKNKSTTQLKSVSINIPDTGAAVIATRDTRSDIQLLDSFINRDKKLKSASSNNDRNFIPPTSENRLNKPSSIFSNSLMDDDEMVIIVNSRNKQLISFSDIKNMYNDRMTSWPDGTKIKLYNLPIDSPVRIIFSKKILNQTPREAATAVSNRVVKNLLRNSMQTKTARLVVSTVSKNLNAIGYAPYSSVKGKGNLRIIMQ